MENIFYGEILEALNFKILIDILSQNLTYGNFEVNSSGISLTQVTNNTNKFFLVKIMASKISSFKFNKNTSFFFSVSMINLQKLLRTIKKDNKIILIITSDSSLTIQINHKEYDEKKSVCKINIDIIQNIQYLPITGYTNKIIISSKEFQKTCKEMVGIGTYLSVDFSEKKMRVECTLDNICTRTNEYIREAENFIPLKQTFLTEYITKLSKLCSFTNQITIQCGETLPILFESDIGTIGHILIYINEFK